jgi:hypothetical protein
MLNVRSIAAWFMIAIFAVGMAYLPITVYHIVVLY